MFAARIIGGIGRALIAAGVLILLFVGYQLWGTGLQEARAQRHLKADFEEALQTTTTTSTTTTVAGDAPPDTTPTTAPEAPPPTPEGEAVAIIKIPKIGVEKAVVQGVRVADLKKGPGHYPTTPMPGQPGNAAIAGHRTTYGAPFYDLNELEVGDPILVTTHQGRFRYEVTEKVVVRPSNTEVLKATDDARLTLTTCNPRYSARERLIVISRLVGEAVEPPPAPPVEDEEPTEIPGDDIDEPDDEPVAFEDPAGLSGDRAARAPAFLWGAVCALIWTATYVLSKRWRWLPAYAIGTPIFLLALFFFFENFARLLPANI